MRELLDRVEEAQPQIFLADVLQQSADQRPVIRLHRPRKYPPTIPENEMPLPLRRIGPNRGFGRGASGRFSRRFTISHGLHPLLRRKPAARLGNDTRRASIVRSQALSPTLPRWLRVSILLQRTGQRNYKIQRNLGPSPF